MSIEVKICGLRDVPSVVAAVTGGGHYLGFVFHTASPRFIDARTAAPLVSPLPAVVTSVGLFVDPTDEEIMRILKLVPLGMIQLHGNETMERVAIVKRMTELPVIKAIGIAGEADVKAAHDYAAVADYLLLDAKPREGARSGGNGVPFDWGLLKNAAFAKPWFLAGGLNEANIAAAVAATGARFLDVSSGVEQSMAVKSPEKIRSFLSSARKLETSC